MSTLLDLKRKSLMKQVIKPSRILCQLRNKAWPTSVQPEVSLSQHGVIKEHGVILRTIRTEHGGRNCAERANQTPS
ncbi:hypothetical protein DPEC_G00164580 [Dallia pectoralis]|uniref:Uncharacterized protein n=1 Tax=Dallia pectoralis TaxID=75939 RepID=A0ACC2GHQ1_DALPE|nr:hypothetical protein DPEC_G00164580 [Dallia pectoralis]